MDVVEAILSVSTAFETVPTYGAQNCRTMANCVDTLHNEVSREFPAELRTGLHRRTGGLT